ncbi:hypothetical protein ACOTJB_19050 [Achromobacter xylosoxidans]
MRIPCPFPHRAGLLLLAALALAPLTAGAQTAPGGACIETEVNGYRALSYGCLNQKMAPDAAPRPPPALGSEAITQRPPNQMGLPTPATIGNRMGNTFGTSAYPQRPTP